MEIDGPGSFDGYDQDSPADIVRWLADKSVEERTSTQPELAPYVRFSDDDRATILSLFQQIYGIIEQPKKDAHNARYNDLMRGYRPSRPRLTNGNGTSTN